MRHYIPKTSLILQTRRVLYSVAELFCAILPLSKKNRINNWDLVDSSAKYILGEYLCEVQSNQIAKPVITTQILYEMATSHNIWHRRIAIVATHAFIARGEYQDTLKLAEMLMSDTHDLIHKAVGWMLREVGKRSPATLRKEE